MKTSFPITIIGGGIAGIATAIALRRSGFDVRVFERGPETYELGAGITLWANAVAILDRWGIANALRSQGNVIESGELLNTLGRPLIRTPVGAVGRQVGSYSVGIHRAALLRILVDALPTDQLSYGAECLDVEERPNGVMSRMSDGRVECSRVLVGADGIRSAVYRALHGEPPLRYAGYVCYRGIVPYADADLPFGHAFEVWGRGRRFGAIRLEPGRVYWFANENADPAEEPVRVELPRLREKFARWPAPISQLLDAADPSTTLRHAIYDRPYRWDRQGRGRVTLVGDAAHPMTPDLGQGACQAIEDAEALAQALASATDEATALRYFEALRRRRVSWIVRRSRFQGWVGQHPSRIGCWMRDLLMRWTPAAIMRNEFRNLLEVQHFGSWL